MKVLNMGSLNYDFVYNVDHMVRPGETEASEGMETFFGGKGLNQSIALAKAGVPVYHAGLIGEDGSSFLTVCKENGVNTTYIKSVEGKSGHTIIQIDKNAQNSILLYGGSNRKFTKDYVDSVLNDFEKGDFLLLQNEVNELPYIIEKAFEKGMLIILNPSPLDDALKKCDLSKISYFLMNEIEGKEITGKADPEEILATMRATYPNAKVVLTLGEDGVIYRDEEKTVKQGIFKVKAVDTTAAGDTFTGFFISSLIRNLPVEEALRIASKASSIAVSRKGATSSIPKLEEVL